MKTIEELEGIIKDQREMIKSLCDEWAEDDTHIENYVSDSGSPKTKCGVIIITPPESWIRSICYVL